MRSHAMEDTGARRRATRPADRRASPGCRTLRRPDVMKLLPEEVEGIIRYQVGALTGFLKSTTSGHQPHPSRLALRHARQRRGVDARRAVRAKDYGVPVYGLAGTQHQLVAGRRASRSWANSMSISTMTRRAV